MGNIYYYAGGFFIGSIIGGFHSLAWYYYLPLATSGFLAGYLVICMVTGCSNHLIPIQKQKKITDYMEE